MRFISQYYKWHFLFDFHFVTIPFQDAIGRVNASGNLDSPEGGLDALMQATVCTVS